MKACKSGKLLAAATAIGCSGDLLPEILVRLPARDLMRLKSVSRHWKRIISDPRFAARHTRSTDLRPPAGVILYRYLQCSELLETVPVPLFGNPPAGVPSLSFMTEIFANLAYRFCQIQSCNGLLLCLFSQFHEFVLDLQSHCFVCNPTTRVFKLLPLPSYLKENEWLDGLTLVFNPSEPLCYKVIGIKKYYMTTGFMPGDEGPHELHIYSSETNCWKLGSVMHGLEPGTRLSGAFLNDRVYWSGMLQMHYYNVYSEEIGSVPLPLFEFEYPVDESWNFFLVASFGHLYSILFRFTMEGHEYQIFEFDSIAMKWSNLQEEAFDLGGEVEPCCAYPMVVARGDNREDCVLLLSSPMRLIIFDLVSHKSIREIEMVSSLCYAACHYIPSLAPV